jgi:uncharacterized protein (DUF697 family)
LATSVSFSKILKAVTDARGTAEAPRLCVIGAGPDLARVVGVLSAGAKDEAGGISAHVDALAPADFPREQRLASRWDIVILVAAGCPAGDAAPAVHAARRAGATVIGLVEDADSAWAEQTGLFDDEIARGLGHAPAGKPTLERKIVDAAGDGAGALAQLLPSVRRTHCDHVVITNAAQNGVIGAVVIIPGADMPAMTANQVRMVLKIAHAYGEELTLDRTVEILTVVGAGFVLRTLARQALDFVPGFGWAVKGAVGFSGTVALGQAAIAYFENGAPLRVSRMQRVNRQVEKLTSRLPGPLKRLASG